MSYRKEISSPWGLAGLLLYNSFYEEVGKQQLVFAAREERALINEYVSWRSKLHWYILQRDRCVNYFLKVYDGIVQDGTSIARLSSQTNTRKEGHNAAIDQLFNDKLNPGQRAKYSNQTLKQVLFNLKLSNEIYEEMLEHLKLTPELTEIQENMSEIESKLLRSMLMAACGLGKEYTSRLLGVDEQDAVQEVLLYFVHSIRRYDPTYRTPSGKRVKLLTYCYSRAERLLKEWVLTTSRLVRIPRNKMERALIVAKAYDKLDQETNLYVLTEESNVIITRRKKDKLKEKDLFTTEEVDKLIKILTSNYIHIDKPYNNHHTTPTSTIGDMLVTEDPLAVDLIQQAHKRERLIKLMKETLDKTEYQVMMLRWFHNEIEAVPRALAEVGPLLASEYGGTKYSRESIRKIENSAIQKLKDRWEIKRLW